MPRTLHTLGLSAVFAAALGVAPTDASAANCNFSKAEKISMVSWVIPLAGAVMTPLACKRDLFNKSSKGAAAAPAGSRANEQLRILDRRRRRAI